MKFSHFSIAIFLSAAFARADFDFKPYVSNNKIFAGGHDDEQGADVDVLRTGNYDFGDEPQDPYNTGDPGFNTVGASSFLPGSSLRLMGMPVAGAYLRFWDGTGAANFDTRPAATTLSLAGSPARSVTFGASSLTELPSTDTSLLIGNFASTNGALHVHLTSSIFQSGAQIIGSVPEGAYLLSFDLLNPGTGVASSDPFFIVYNNALSNEANDAAIAYVNATFVPEPAAIGLASVIAMISLRRTRRT